jgi:hypothetical protein
MVSPFFSLLGSPGRPGAYEKNGPLVFHTGTKGLDLSGLAF